MTWTSQTDHGRCNYAFKPGRVRTSREFTGSSVVRAPRHGVIKQINVARFRYHATKGYKGEDSYSFRVCANTPAGSGCSTINVSMTVL
ncbi:hypothetical protein [Terrarubrum flagellatum]|uniref:hypothetical protein n=1 Tax=Terrirubrum flagellatum TaxID=2895980 RepID=UPI0031453032